MNKGRLETFSDAVIAIILTIMVLNLRVPSGDDLETLKPLIPRFTSYVLSFIFVGIYWNIHHHLMQEVKTVNGAVIFANLHLLFWLSLIPFVTAWMGENGFKSLPVAFYGVVLSFAALAYHLLVRVLISNHQKRVRLAHAIGGVFKGKVSFALYAVAIPGSFLQPWIGYGIYTLVAVMWLVPNSRFERKLSK